MKLFPTQIQTYRNCPKKFWYSRQPEIRAQYARASPHLVLGNAVHDALEAFFDVTRVPVGDRTYERLSDLLRDAWAGRGVFRRNSRKQAEARQQAFDGDRAAEKSWGEKGLNILYRFFQTADLAVVPLTSEQFHERWVNARITLGGKIDRIDRLPDGRLVILDYKTGKPPRRRKDDREIEPSDTAPVTYRRVESPGLKSDDLQLAHYALIVSRKYRGNVARCSYLYLNDDLEIGYEPDDAQLEQRMAEIVALCEEIESTQMAEERFEPTPNALCPWCDYRELCPRGDEWEKGRAAGVEQTELPF